jgi:hypothetical protein
MEQTTKQSVQTIFTDEIPPNSLPSGTGNLTLGGIAEVRNFLFPFSQRVSVLTYLHIAPVRLLQPEPTAPAKEPVLEYLRRSFTLIQVWGICADPGLGQMKL